MCLGMNDSKQIPRTFQDLHAYSRNGLLSPKKYTGSNAGVKGIIFFFANGVNSAPVLLIILVSRIFITGILFSG